MTPKLTAAQREALRSLAGPGDRERRRFSGLTAATLAARGFIEMTATGICPRYRLTPAGRQEIERGK